MTIRALSMSRVDANTHTDNIDGIYHLRNPRNTS
jgi:hypothetical protein